ncbi:hypothetical protein BU16DRAFT_525578 [Lophium mytilinum]|uniref:Mediator of RNA polymerase II transcription subunit 20 n=1 Tax=Lophium mytilinum TaxID=390894 RepID=A0A6A6R0H9_9PEZI|nr:hypothetical protein BU16DRAFT_525578 [Lophium mytilinum]
MNVSGLYFVAEQPSSSSASGSSAFQNIVSAIQLNFIATPLPNWHLAHHLSLSTPATSGDTNPPAYHHALSLTYHPGKTFLHIHPQPVPGVPTKPGPDNVVVAIPATQAESFNNLLATKLSALWTPKHSLNIRDGHAYRIGEMVIRVGEVRAAKGVGGNPPALHGVVVCIESRVGDANTSDDDYAPAVPSKADVSEGVMAVHEMIRGLWNDLEVPVGRKEGVKMALGQYEGLGEEHAAEAEVRMWCQILRLRA